jgi:hypothetical protein
MYFLSNIIILSVIDRLFSFIATMKNLYVCTTFVFMTINLIIFSSLYFVNKPDECIALKQVRRNCYESDAKIMLEIFYELKESNKTAFILCGAVIKCETSPCFRDNIKLNVVSYCEPFHADNTILTISSRISSAVEFVKWMSILSLIGSCLTIILGILLNIHLIVDYIKGLLANNQPAQYLKVVS